MSAGTASSCRRIWSRGLIRATTPTTPHLGGCCAASTTPPTPLASCWTPGGRRASRSRGGPGWRGAGRQRHGEGVEPVGDEGVVPAQRDQLDQASVPEQPVGRVVGGLIELAGPGELAGHGVDRPLVVGLERRILTPADGVYHQVGHPVLARHPGGRPPLELRLPAGTHGDDGKLAQPPLDRRLKPQLAAQRAEPPAYARGVYEGIERADQAALRVHQLAAPRADDSVPHSLAVGVKVVITKIRKSAHGTTLVTATGTGPAGRCRSGAVAAVNR